MGAAPGGAELAALSDRQAPGGGSETSVRPELARVLGPRGAPRCPEGLEAAPRSWDGRPAEGSTNLVPFCPTKRGAEGLLPGYQETETQRDSVVLPRGR